MKSKTTLLAALIMLGAAGASLPAQANTAATPVQLAQTAAPTTYMTRQGPNAILIQITDGSFYFRDEMQRGYGNTYQATDHGYRVIYDGDSGRVVVISATTGVEFYNYFYTGTVGGSSGSSGGDYGTAPPGINSITRISDNEYSVELSEGQFYFNAPLYRSSGDTFVGVDGRFRAIYDRSNSRMVVINLSTGEEIFNYVYSEVDEGYL